MKIENLAIEPNKENLSPKYLDYLLFLALKSSKDLPVEKRSIVVAGVYDPQTANYFIGYARNVNTETGYGKWNHAEYEAMMFALENGVDLTRAIVVTSLGPCLIDSTSRAHKSCSEILVEAGVKSVHIGVLDNRQADVALYRKMGLQTTVSQDQLLSKVCADLNDYFNPKREERMLGQDKASYIDEVLKCLPEEWEK
jgi:pyrimidine deaminase RibD-like protein